MAIWKCIGHPIHSILGVIFTSIDLLSFSCHAIDNPSMRSEIKMLRQYGPNVPEETLSRLVKAFSELRAMADDGQIQVSFDLIGEVS